MHRAFLVLGLSVFLAAGLRAQSLRPGGAPSGAWAGYLAKPSAELPFLPLMGLQGPGALEPLARILDAGGLSPDALSGLSAERQAQEVRRALDEAAQDAIVRSGNALAPQAPADEQELDALSRELGDFRPFLTQLSRSQALGILEASRQTSENEAAIQISRAKAQTRGWVRDARAGDAGAARTLDEISVRMDRPEGLWENIVDETLRHRAKVLDHVAQSAREGSARRRRIAPLAERRQAEIDEARIQSAASPDARAFLFKELAGRAPLTSEQRSDFEQLRAYSPGLDPDWAVWGSEALDLRDVRGGASGWANHFDLKDGEGRRRQGFIYIKDDSSWSWTVQVALHEGFHQGDLGYQAGTRALQLWGLDPTGRALSVALIEGYTEHRTREAFLRLLNDGMSGKSELGTRVLGSLRLKYATLSNGKAVERVQDDWEYHSYDGYVRMVRAILSIKGGEEAMEAFVRRGEIAPLARVLGPKRLQALGELAELRWKLTPDELRQKRPSSREAAELADAAGLPAWLMERMVQAASEPEAASAETLRSAKRTAYVLLREGRATSKGLGKRSRKAWLEQLDGLDLNKYFRLSLEPAKMAAQLRAKLDSKARTAWLWSLIPSGAGPALLGSALGLGWLKGASLFDSPFREILVLPLLAGLLAFTLFALRQAFIGRGTGGLHPVLRNKLR